jgi:propanediol dehydratase small subunit
MILNVMESHVQDAYDRLKHSVNGFVDSPTHREDVIVYALNRLQPRYVVTAAGKAVTEVALDSSQHRTTIDVQVLEGLRQVARVPRDRPVSPPG